LAESIESLRRATLEVVDLPVDALEPDPANPNVVPPALLKALARDISENGFVQPVVVRPKGSKYVIEDGEHRWRVLRDAGSDTVPCVIDDGDESEGRMRLLTMNHLRGSFNAVRLARVLAYLAEHLDEAELQERLGMDEEQWEAALALKDVPEDLDEQLAAVLEAEEASAPEVLRWRFGPRQATTVERALEAKTAQGMTRAEALIAILSG